MIALTLKIDNLWFFNLKKNNHDPEFLFCDEVFAIFVLM